MTTRPRVALAPASRAGASPLALTVELPDGLIEQLRTIVREECALALDGQAPPPVLLTDAEVCSQVLRVSQQTLRVRLIPAGIPHLWVGDQRRWRADQVLLWLEAQQQGVAK